MAGSESRQTKTLFLSYRRVTRICCRGVRRGCSIFHLDEHDMSCLAASLSPKVYLMVYVPKSIQLQRQEISFIISPQKKKSSFNISLYTRVFARVQPRFFAAIILDTTRPHAMSYQYDVLTETNTPIFPHQSPANDLYKAITHAISDSATPQARP